MKKEFPLAGYYIFNIPKDMNKPAFLFNSTKRSSVDGNYYLNKIKLELQILYFGIKNDVGIENVEEKLKTIEKLDGILGEMNIKVKDRNLRFNYSYGDVDGHFTINLNFEFMDEKEVDLKSCEKIKIVTINDGKGCI